MQFRVWCEVGTRMVVIWCSKSPENVVAVLLEEKRAKREKKRMRDRGRREKRNRGRRETGVGMAKLSEGKLKGLHGEERLTRG
ncbi:hypothetical protein DVH24_008288 [Malus domestica]|uniref:Uncharacterized protein n=1 Tax=Malus domestica TaxID=3750 RepID=A0A498JJB2_MALDO|nr:hypothetical protein DVH24_008288 [Malus domestica]